MDKICITVLALLFPSTAVAIPWIADFDGPPDAYSITLAGEDLTTELFQTLNAGTVVSVKDDRYFLVIAHPDGSQTRLTRQDSPWIAVNPGATHTVVDNFLSWAADSLAELKGEDRYPAVNMMTRQVSIFGPPIRFIFPSERSPVLLAGEEFSIVFQGGDASTRFELSNSNQRFQIDQLSSVPSGFRIASSNPPLILSKNEYKLRVKSTSEPVLRITVLSRSALPQPPAAYSSSGVPDQLGKLGYIVWLATQENGRWAAVAHSQLGSDDSHGAHYLRHIIRHRFAGQ